MMNLNNNNMQMQNQFMNFSELKIEEIIKPFQEKIKTLEEEIRQKDLEIARLKIKLLKKDDDNPMPQFFNNNNNNQMNNQFQMPHQFNQMNNQFQMPNQFNQTNYLMNKMNNNQFNQMNNNMAQKDTHSPNISRNLNIEFQIENSGKISVQCKSDEKMEDAINKFCCKANLEKELYKFLFNVFVEKKKTGDIVEEKNAILSSLQRAEKFSVANKLNDEISGDPIYINFNSSSGLKVMVLLGKNNTVKEAILKYCKKIDIPESIIGKKIVFLFNGHKLDVNGETKLGQIFGHDNVSITVVDQSNLVGA